MSDGSVIIDTLIDTKGFGKGVSSMQTQFAKIGGAIKKVGLAIVSAFSVQQIVNFAKEAIELGSDLQEVQNVVDVTFGEMSSQIDAFAKNAIKQFGLSELAAKQYTSTLGAILKSSGFSTAQSLEMSKTLAGLTGDIASFYNLSSEDAFNKIRAGITGETEPLKQLGINLSEANLEAYALSQGLSKTYAAMSQQEKMLLRYNYILHVTADAQGDFARTSSGWANQTRILSEQFNSLKATIGQGLINALTPVLQVINTIISGLQAMANAFRQFTALLFGDAGGGKAAENAENMAGSYDDAADSAEQMAAATGAAGKAAKKYLTGLDELNTYTSNSGGGGALGSDLLADLDLSGGLLDVDLQDEISPKIAKIVNKINKLVAPLKKIDFSRLSSAFKNLKAAVEPISTALFSGLEWAWYNLLVPMSAWTIEDVIPEFLYALSGALDFVNSILVAVKPLLSWLWSGFLQPIARWAGNTIAQTLKKIGDRLKDISEWVLDHQSTVETLTIIVGSFAAAWGLVNGAIAVWNTVAGVATGVTTAFGAAVAFLTSPIGIVTVALGAIIAAIVLVAKNWDTLKAKALSVWESITAAWGQAKTWVNNKIVSPISTAFQKVKTTLQSIFSSLVSVIRTPVNGIIGAINGMISGVVSGINTVIRALNRINFKIPNWVPRYGGNRFGFNLSTISAPQIPYLAKGAVIPPNAPFMAVLGDQKHGTNIEAPADLISQILATELDKREGGGIYNVNLVVNGRTILKAVLDEAKLQQSRTGINPLLLY